MEKEKTTRPGKPQMGGRHADALLNRGGFTLLEVLVVVFILGILAALVAPRFMGRTEDAKVTEAKVQIRNFETALKLFKLDNGFYPATEQGLEALIEPPTVGREAGNFRTGGYLERNRIPLDPWGTPYIYASPGLTGDFDILSLGADGQEGGDGHDADIHNWDMD
jgi:general secretion pathway protein G